MRPAAPDEQERADAGRRDRADEHAEVDQVPATLGAVLDALEADHEFLLAGDVFTPDLIETWIEIKRAEIQAIAVRPHPHEFELYYDC